MLKKVKSMNFLFKLNKDKKSYIVTGTDYEDYDLRSEEHTSELQSHSI